MRRLLPLRRGITRKSQPQSARTFCGMIPEIGWVYLCISYAEKYEDKIMPMYGYARVSTRDQDLTAQDAELMAAGCAKVFKEKASGAKTDRPELAKLIRRLELGDVVVVVRLDRLARSTRDLL